MPLDQCLLCRYRRDTFIFQLCTHPKSEYKKEDKVDWHTRAYMMKVHNGICPYQHPGQPI